MRANATTMKTRIKRVREKLEPPPARETRLPYLVKDSDTGGDLPGYEEHNREHERRARRLQCAANVYSFDPFLEEGSEE